MSGSILASAKVSHESEDITVVKIYLANKPDFLSKEKLAAELDCSTEYIEKLMRQDVLKEEEHFIRNGRLLRFYYPAILKMFAPKLIKS